MTSSKRSYKREGTAIQFSPILGFAYSFPDFWLEVSLHPEGPASGQLDQGFPWFSLIPEQMLSWYPNSTLLCSAFFTCSPPDGNFNIFALMQPLYFRSRSNSSYTQPTPNATKLNFNNTSQMLSSYRKDERALPGNLQSS
jgi:hypothetical protein